MSLLLVWCDVCDCWSETSYHIETSWKTNRSHRSTCLTTSIIYMMLYNSLFVHFEECLLSLANTMLSRNWQWRSKATAIVIECFVGYCNSNTHFNGNNSIIVDSERTFNDRFDWWWRRNVGHRCFCTIEWNIGIGILKSKAIQFKFTKQTSVSRLRNWGMRIDCICHFWINIFWF